jgi:hypothetical protein
MEQINEKTIWNSKQNHPELVVQDCRKEFNLSEDQCQKLRFILMNRGINKWLYGRRLFIKLKHKVKSLRAEAIKEFGEKHKLVKFIKFIQEKMQNIAKNPRWIEWGTHVHKKMGANEREIVIKGNHC